MPIKNIFINCTHYWILFGAVIGLILRPGYTPPKWVTPAVAYCFTAAFGLFALLNGATHVV